MIQDISQDRDENFAGRSDHVQRFTITRNWRGDMEAAGKDSIASHYQGADGKKYALGRRHDVLNDLGSDLQCRYFTKFLKKDMNVLDFGCLF